MRPILIIVALLALGGCNLIYKADIQQGNVLDQRLVDDLRPGMTKRQVSLILGTPAIASPFRHDRWDYIAIYRRRGEIIDRKLLSLTFEDDRLVKIEGDYKPGEADVIGDETSAEDESA